MATRKPTSGSTKRKAPDHTIRGEIGGGPGASDAYSGGGNASGTPDAETAMRLGRPPGQSNVQQDKAKLFPERAPQKSSKPRAAKAPKARTSKPLKKHGDKFKDKIPTNTRSKSKRR
jgi:hypothetical protein